MDKLPIEIIINIFSFLPQKYVLIGTTLCKIYYNALLHPLLFKTLHIYSFQQYKKCLELGKRRRAKINHKCINYYVEHIHFHIGVNGDRYSIERLIKVFPNLHSIHCSGLYTRDPQSFPSIKQFEYFHYWYTAMNGNWVQSIHFKQHKIKTLEFKLPVSPRSSYSIHSTVINPEKEIYSTPYLKYNQPIFKLHSIAFPVLYVLTHLSMDCPKYECDEIFFEFIHRLCPQLISFTLKLFTMNITDDYGNDNLIIHDKQPLKPNNRLKELDISAIFCDKRCYDYLSFKYPSLESLSLRLTRENNPNEHFKLAIYDMITHYRCLKKLEIYSPTNEI